MCGTAFPPCSKDLQILHTSAALDSSSVQKPTLSGFKRHTSSRMIFIMLRLCTFEIHPQAVCMLFTWQSFSIGGLQGWIL